MLGIPEVAKPLPQAKRGGVWFETAPSAFISVSIRGFGQQENASRLLVRDLRSLAKSLTEAGYEVTSDERLQGYEHAYVNDPFGNRLEILQPINLRD